MKQIKLTQNKVTFVDDEDYPILNEYQWYYNSKRTGYAVRNGVNPVTNKPCMIYMHREVNKTPAGMFTDHIDGNGLNNTRANLRTCTHSENMWNTKQRINNTSGYKGVYFYNKTKKWKSQIQINGKRKSLGYFTSPELAYEFYCLAADMLHGNFANHGHAK